MKILFYIPLKNILTLLFCCYSLLVTNAALAAIWSTTELQAQHGKLDAPEFLGGQSADTTILTYQHASGWKYGDTFFFVDYLSDNEPDGFNDNDFYSELYVNISMGKTGNVSFGDGVLQDVGLLFGLNMAGDAKARKYLPGIRLSWKLPGFAFFNSDITAYIDDSLGGSGAAPEEDDSYMLDLNWAYPFSLGAQDFSIEGHAEYIAGRENEFGGDVEPWILVQPQFRWDAGKTFLDSPQQLYIGFEWQYWQKKLGDKRTDENAMQALIVWRL